MTLWMLVLSAFVCGSIVIPGLMWVIVGAAIRAHDQRELERKMRR